jgi:hypothetical protein
MFGVVGNAIVALRPPTTPRQRAINCVYVAFARLVLRIRAVQSRQSLVNSKIETKKKRRRWPAMLAFERVFGLSTWLGWCVWCPGEPCRD